MIEEALLNILKNDTEISDIVSTRVYPLKIPQGVTSACITYSLIGGTESYSCDGPEGLVDSRFQITCWAPTHAVAAKLSRLVKKRLNGLSDSTAGIQCSTCSEPTDVPYIGEAEQQNRYGRFLEAIISYNDE